MSAAHVDLVAAGSRGPGGGGGGAAGGGVGLQRVLCGGGKVPGAIAQRAHRVRTLAEALFLRTRGRGDDGRAEAARGRGGVDSGGGGGGGGGGDWLWRCGDVARAKAWQHCLEGVARGSGGQAKEKCLVEAAPALILSRGTGQTHLLA